jgi:multidrug efflux pump subunit AcrA (membrane-fusion protein)
MKPYHRLLTTLLCAALLAGCSLGIGGGAQQVEPFPSAPEQPTAVAPAPGLPTGNTILMDGELVSAAPELALSFSGGAAGELLSIDVLVGRRVQAGDLIATIDDTELQRAVQDAERALSRAIEDRDRARTDADETYQQQLDDAQERYEEELRQAERALAAAQNALERTRMQPPTTTLAEARVNLRRTLEAEAQAHDDYKQALDRPWEPQSIRDTLYSEWQERITDRGLAERRLADAQRSLEAYALDLEAKERDLAQAEEDLARVEMEEVERPEENPTYARAVQDGERQLAEAQDALADAQLRAPRPGLVTSVDAAVGDRISAGTPIVTLIDLASLYFVTDNLSERHVAQLAPGQQAEITLRAYPDTVIAGHIDSVIPQSERSPGDEARFAAYIRLDETPVDLLPGMTGRVEVHADTP